MFQNTQNTQNKKPSKPAKAQTTTATTTATTQQPQQDNISALQMANLIIPYFTFPLIVLAILAWKFNIFSSFRRGKKQIDTEKGSAHFAERGEISKFLKPMDAATEAGTLLIGKWNEKSLVRLKNKFFILPRKLTTRHTLIAAPSGAGKSRTLFLPNLSITQKVSFIATDPKSELFNLTSAAQLNPIRFAPTDPDRSNCFNWIPLCKDVRTAKRCAEAIINAQATGKADPFWSNSEQNLLTAIFIHTAGTETPTPAHAYEILTSGTVSLSNVLINSHSETAQRAGRSFTEADTKIQTGVSQGLIGKLQFLDDPDVRRFTSSSIKPFSFKNLRHKPTQIYWCLRQSDVVELQPLTALFFNLAILQLIDEQGETPVNFYFDEFANIGKLNNFEKDITLLRGQNIAVVAGLQSKSQLASIYGRDNANTIIENFNNKIILAGLQSDTAKDFAEMLGKFTFTDIRTSAGKSSSPNSFFGSHSSNESYYTSERALLTADELRRLPENNLILISTNMPPVYLETNFFTGDKPNAAQITGCAGELATPTYAMTMKPPKAKKAKIAEFEDFEKDKEFNINDFEDTSAKGF
jgi:type IV secretion system protein VirD4